MKSMTDLAQPTPTRVTQTRCHRPMTAPTARAVLIGLMCRMTISPDCSAAALVGHHKRNWTGAKELARHAAEQEFAGPAVAVAPHDNVLGTRARREVDEILADLLLGQ